MPRLDTGKNHIQRALRSYDYMIVYMKTLTEHRSRSSKLLLIVNDTSIHYFVFSFFLYKYLLPSISIYLPSFIDN